MYVKLKSGHRQLPVSRRITAKVATHWAQRAKNTRTESATGMVNTGRSLSSYVALRSLASSASRGLKRYASELGP